MYNLLNQSYLLTALIEYLTVLLEYYDLLQTRWQGTASIWDCLVPANPDFDYFVLCLCMAYNSGIIFVIIVHYYYYS